MSRIGIGRVVAGGARRSAAGGIEAGEPPLVGAVHLDEVAADEHPRSLHHDVAHQAIGGGHPRGRDRTVDRAQRRELGAGRRPEGVERAADVDLVRCHGDRTHDGVGRSGRLPAGERAGREVEGRDHLAGLSTHRGEVPDRVQARTVGRSGKAEDRAADVGVEGGGFTRGGVDRGEVVAGHGGAAVGLERGELPAQVDRATHPQDDADLVAGAPGVVGQERQGCAGGDHAGQADNDGEQREERDPSKVAPHDVPPPPRANTYGENPEILLRTH